MPFYSKKPAIVAAFALACAAFTGCRKDDDNAKTPQCRITTIQGNPYTGSYSYDAQGRLTYKSSQGPGQLYENSYSYNGNTVMIQKKSNGLANGYDSVTLNADGYIVNYRYYYKDNSWWNEVNEYNANNEIMKTTRLSGSGGTPEVSTYIYNDGNITAANHDGHITAYEYDVTRPSQPGDYFSYAQLNNYGLKRLKTKNLVIKSTYGTDVSTFQYTFADGHVTQLQRTYNGSDDGTFTFTYKCE